LPRTSGTQTTNTTILAVHRTQGFASPVVSPAGAERRGPYRYNLGMRRSPSHAPQPDRQPPVPGHPRPGESRRTLIAGSRHGTDSLMSRAQSWPPGPDRRQPALACALGGQIRDGHRIKASRRAGIKPPQISHHSVNIPAFSLSSRNNRKTVVFAHSRTHPTCVPGQAHRRAAPPRRCALIRGLPRRCGALHCQA
jgi:hypothetical protein